MSFIAVAIGAGAIGSAAGGILGAGAAKDAASAQAAAAAHAADLQKQMYDQTRQDQAPWRQAGAQALSQLSDPSLMQRFSQDDFQRDPGYQFRMDQGQKALEASAAARGGLMSGGTMKALNEYGQNFASNEYQNAYNRFTNDQSNRFNRLSSIAGIGQTANAQLGAAGMNYANQAGDHMMGAANAYASGQIGSANAWNGAIGGAGKMGMEGMWMGKMYPGKPGTPGADPSGAGSLSGMSSGGGFNLGVDTSMPAMPSLAGL